MRFYLAESETLDRVADITGQCTEKSLQLSLNRPGTFNFTMPLFTEFKDYLNPVQYCVIATKNSIPRWSGPIWSRRDRFAAEKIELSATGWFSLLRKRFITDANITYTNKTPGYIAHSLLQYANAQTIASVTRPTWIVPGTDTSEGSFTRTYNRWQNISQEILGLSDIESGFNFEIDPTTREMNISNWDEYRDNTSTVFGFNFGPHNTIDVTREMNADDLGNQQFAVGQYGIAEADEPSSVDIYNLHQDVNNINEISDISILGAIANAELAVNSLPRTTINFDPRPEGSDNVPKIFDDYILGDKVYLTAKRDNVSILNQAIRIFGITITIDNNGLERVSSLQTTAQGGS